MTTELQDAERLIKLLQEVIDRQGTEIDLARAEAQRLRTVIRMAADCLPDMPAVCCQTIQLFVEGGN
jgi:hypothetical protein